jgi:F-type H+-transporting ATPase subunit delta
MQDYRININYAKALFLLADETGDQERVSEDMRLVNDVCAENRELNIVFRNPEVKSPKKVAIVEDIFGASVCKTTMAFLQFVVRKKRSVNLKGISASYLDLYRESRGIVLSHITTAQPVDDHTRALATKVIADYTHKEVELVAKTDPKIIGGLAMEFDNRMYDARISTYLSKLRHAFDENVYESKL